MYICSVTKYTQNKLNYNIKCIPHFLAILLTEDSHCWNQYNIPIVYTHRVITVIEVQRLVVLGSTALFTMVWQLRIYDDRDEGWENFLFVWIE